MKLLLRILLVSIFIYWLYFNNKKVVFHHYKRKRLLIINFLKFTLISFLIINYAVLYPYQNIVALTALLIGNLFLIIFVFFKFNKILKKSVIPEFLAYSIIIILIVCGFQRYNHQFFNEYKKVAHSIVYPFQKRLAIMSTGVEFTLRKDKFITHYDVENIRSQLKPGDILLRRNDWQVTNLGIQGFWTHSGIYVGTLEELDNYFADVKELKGKKFSQVLKSKNRQAYKKLKNDKSLTIIEAVAPKVTFNPLYNIAKSDYFSALRPTVSKEEKMRAILKSVEYLGCPYDYDFDFSSDDAFVCTELVKKSYSNSLNFKLKNVHGQKVILPNDIVEKYAKENKDIDKELSFVLFYDGDYELKKADIKNKYEFNESYLRNKEYFVNKCAAILVGIIPYVRKEIIKISLVENNMKIK